MFKNKNSFLFTMFVLWMGHFLVDFMIGIWPVYKTMAHLDLALAGLLAGGSAFLGEGAQLVFGWLSDRGYRRMLILLGILLACSATLYTYADGYAIYFFLLLLTCIGSGAFHPSAVGLISSLTEHRKALFISIFTTGGTLGVGLSQLIFSSFYSILDGHMVALAIPSILLISIVFLRPFFSTPSKVGTTNEKRIELKNVFQLFRNKKFFCLYLSLICNTSVSWGMIFLLPDLLKVRTDEVWLWYGGGQLCMSLGSVIMMFPGGYLADRYSPKLVILWATALSIICFYSLLLIPDPSVVTIMSLLFILGAMMLLVQPVSLAIGNRLIPEHPGTVSACLMGLVWCVSELIGPSGSGFLTQFFVENAPVKALAILGVFFFIGGLFVIPLPKLVTKRVLSAES